ncbi:MAG: helix-turn-helix domain-containing protein [Holosporales bacterium]|jgi:transcriptional regulator with XRE-family HTH domain|nr:helix-turn-helix domain-containing protein [Holosporales bacterium]
MAPWVSMTSDPSLGIRLGAFIRHRRMQLGMTQRDLAKSVGITAQQVQKYESGANALRVSRLMQFSHALNCPLGNFLLVFDKTHVSPEGTLQESASTFSVPPPTKQDLELSSEEIDKFLVEFFSLSRENQNNVIKIVKALASQGS